MVRGLDLVLASELTVTSEEILDHGGRRRSEIGNRERVSSDPSFTEPSSFLGCPFLVTNMRAARAGGGSRNPADSRPPLQNPLGRRKQAAWKIGPHAGGNVMRLGVHGRRNGDHAALEGEPIKIIRSGRWDESACQDFWKDQTFLFTVDSTQIRWHINKWERGKKRRAYTVRHRRQH